MPCYHPLHGYRSSRVNPRSGKSPVVFSLSRAGNLLAESVSVPCGRCIGCRLEYSRQWAIRCMHEAQMHEDSCFITLTYDDDHQPLGGSLVKSDLQEFWKRLRKPLPARSVSYYACGEYGDRTRRPHYHAIVFGYGFPDRQAFGQGKDGSPTWISAELQKRWPFGHSVIGSVTFESAAYVSRYCAAKVTGDAAREHYEVVDMETGEVFRRIPEFAAMSLKPAIAKRWFDRWSSDVYPSDSVVARGLEMKPPKYYDGLYEIADPQQFQKLKEERKRAAAAHAGNATTERLRVREEVTKARMTQLKRESQ